MTDDLQQELTRQATAVRGLARALLRDPHSADDVSQQALTSAWSARGKLAPGPLGGWLRRTVTNFSRQWRRGERRRADHERRGVREAATASPLEALQRRESLRAVTDAVLSLDEPYQTTVFLRYFEDLPPRVIARRTDTNVATVKSRLARGLAQLRQRLDHNAEGGRDWRPALAAAFGLPAGAALLPATTSVLLMTTTLKVSVAAAVLCVGGLMLYRSQALAPPTATTTEELAEGPAAQSAETSRDAATRSERTAVAAPSGDDAWLAHPFVHELEVLVLDETGVPVEGYRPRLAPPGGALRDAQEATDATGRVVVRIPARTQRIDIELLDPRRHRRLLTLTHGAPRRVAMIHEVQGFRLSTGSYTTVRFISSLDHVALPGSGGSTKLEPGLHPHAQFSETGLVTMLPPEASPNYVTQSDFIVGQSNLALDVSGITFQPSTLQRYVADVRYGNPPPSTDAVLEGTIFGEDGAPARKLPVALFGSGAQPLHRVETDDEGRYRFDKIAAGDFTVRAGGTAAGLSIASVKVATGVNRSDLHLRREACVRGVLRGADGEPVAGAQVEWLADDGSWADRTTTDAEGGFVLANLPAVRGAVFAWGKDGRRTFPIARTAGVLPDTGDLALAVEPTAGSTLRLQPSAHADARLDELRLRVRQVATGISRGFQVPRTETTTIGKDGEEQRATIETPDGPWSYGGLPAGFYEVEVWLPGCGGKHLGRHWIDGKSDCDLGNVPLPTPGRLLFDVPAGRARPDDLRVEITSLRAPFDVRIDPLRTLDHEKLLAPGDYVLATQRGEQAPAFRRFAVGPGQVTTLELDW